MVPCTVAAVILLVIFAVHRPPACSCRDAQVQVVLDVRLPFVACFVLMMMAVRSVGNDCDVAVLVPAGRDRLV